MIPITREDAVTVLKVCAGAPDDRFDVTACAFACAVHENPDRDTHQAQEVLADITRLAKARQPTTALGFGQLLFGDFGFAGCHGDYEAPENGDLIDILINKKGLPIGLGHVWRHSARVVNAPLFGTDTPGHFLLRLESHNGPDFLDPFDGGSILDENQLHDLARRAGLAQFSARMLAPASDKTMAIRLQTNLSTRAKARGDHEAWHRAAFRRAILAPNSYQVALDYAHAAQATGHIKTALDWSQRAAALPDAPKGEPAKSLAQQTTNLHKTLN